MFNTNDQTNNVTVKNEIPFKDKYPSFFIRVSSVKTETFINKYPWLKDTHNEININNGEFIGVIHKGISGFIVEGHDYYVWFVDNDDHHRYLEVVLVNRVV